MSLTIVPDILVVDNDDKIRHLLSEHLGDQGFRVRTASNLHSCREILARCPPDLIILEVMLPDGSGLDLCRDLQNHHSRVPVILLTVLKEDIDRILGLEIGADDYLCKPFNPRELTARIRAVLRRMSFRAPPASQAKCFRFADIILDPQRSRITRSNGEPIALTGAEFDLLRTFLERAGRLLSRDQLLDLTQRRDRDPADRSIDVLISRLRRKLGETADEPIFRTIRNGGYQLTVAVTTVEPDFEPEILI